MARCFRTVVFLDYALIWIGHLENGSRGLRSKFSYFMISDRDLFSHVVLTGPHGGRLCAFCFLCSKPDFRKVCQTPLTKLFYVVQNLPKASLDFMSSVILSIEDNHQSLTYLSLDMCRYPPTDLLTILGRNELAHRKAGSGIHGAQVWWSGGKL